jgi:hypothetical protein
MAKPTQYLDQNDFISGFYSVTSPQALTDAQSTVFDANEITCILIVSDAGVEYSLGTNPTGSGTLHKAPAGAFPLVILAGYKIYISGSATISVVE